MLANTVRHRSVASDIERSILALLDARAPRASICPSEVARAVGKAQGENWRDLMLATREAAIRMALSGGVLITRKGEVLDPRALGRGPIRLQKPLQ